MISVEGLTVEFGGNPLFDDITYVINKKDRIALVGKNGAGKSTMLKIIAGLQSPTSGSVNMPKDLTIGYLPQQMKLADSRTVMNEAEQAFSHIFELQSRIERMNEELSVRTDYESEEYHELIERVSNATEQLSLIGAASYQAEIEKTLTGLGFLRSDFDRPTSEFSGGWRMRIELAKLLLQRPDVLLLDEPTNHLDIESIQWLENFLSTRANAVVLVSHDRAFIDNVTTRTIEISLGRIYDYQVNYSKYVILRQERLEQQIRAFENQQKQIQDTEAFIERFRYKATKSVQVQSRIKQLEKIERVEIDEVDNSRLNLKFPPAPRSGDYPIIAEGVGKNYGEHIVFSGADFILKRGEKVAFVGKNGEGKSTLVKCIMGEIPYTGTLKLGHNVKIGYFAQNQAQLLNEELTVFDTIDKVAVGDIRTKIRDILGAFMFGGEASDKKVKVLSGGEKTRLAMIRLLLEPVNLLILDEPTNHLDMRTKDVLKQAIADFNGTVILVSHDREFLDGLVTKVYEFGNQCVREHLGGIYDFLQRKKMDSLHELEVKAVKDEVKSKAAVEERSVTGNKLTYEERKELARQIKKMEKSVVAVEEEIKSLEALIAEVESKLSTVEGAADVSLYEEHGRLKKELDNAMWQWAEQSESLEKIKNKN
ncbi:ABC-F family ATP-binding cassette domain-containing protein [Barnesiella propionica]|uniref:ABC-F family ATP-binding cassette domain-containing protein n=1 Tax=Barnesiella propionica TaxID=2981781 RepID=UPI0011CA4E5E|nr:ABC-F family ATP-binding cassette domain-containing protein [Barnesiella propionica]MCU6768041.1 ABC-F family ATP-binding cassette domain-containing protein [Barnesiella propionica]